MKEETQFTAKGDKTVFVVTNINNRSFYYAWVEGGNILSTYCPIKTAKGMFRSGQWQEVKKKRRFSVK